MLNGFYSVYYTGRTGSGFGVLVLKDGIVTGADVSGGLFDGEYTVHEERAVFEGTIRLTIPPGVPLVTGAPANQNSYTQNIPISMPLDLNQGKPVLLSFA
jgi:hypothetical protein